MMMPVPAQTGIFFPSSQTSIGAARKAITSPSRITEKTSVNIVIPTRITKRAAHATSERRGPIGDSLYSCILDDFGILDICCQGFGDMCLYLGGGRLKGNKQGSFAFYGLVEILQLRIMIRVSLDKITIWVAKWRLNGIWCVPALRKNTSTQWPGVGSSQPEIVCRASQNISQ